ncbi:MAG: cytochrome-c oxidase, cbb3-type subunit III [Pseudomonadales bacterium]
MSAFWSAWIIVLTVITLVGIIWILFANSKTDDLGGKPTTGHVYDGIEEYNNPLPAWWLYLFVATIVFGVGYLAAYPGLGSYSGFLGWTQIKQWEKELDVADKKYSSLFAQYADTPVEELSSNPAAMKMGRRLFANNCAQCHGSDARGSYGFPNLTDSSWLYGSSAETIKASISDGRLAAMPGWVAALEEEGVTQVSAYVLSLGGGVADEHGSQAVDAAALQEGQKKFQMFCVSCHGAEAKGSTQFGAPDLTDEDWLYGGSMEQVAHSIRSGRNGQMPAHKDLISANKIHLLTAYVYSLSAQQTPKTSAAAKTRKDPADGTTTSISQAASGPAKNAKL